MSHRWAVLEAVATLLEGALLDEDPREVLDQLDRPGSLRQLHSSSATSRRPPPRSGRRRRRQTEDIFHVAGVPEEIFRSALTLHGRYLPGRARSETGTNLPPGSSRPEDIFQMLATAETEQIFRLSTMTKHTNRDRIWSEALKLAEDRATGPRSGFSWEDVADRLEDPPSDRTIRDTLATMAELGHLSETWGRGKYKQAESVKPEP